MSALQSARVSDLMARLLMLAAVVRNRRAHAHLRSRWRAPERPDLLLSEPDTPLALADDLCRFAKAGVELLVIDGGDGTVREVLTALPTAFGARPPLLAVLASGKTNILAFDLGVRRSCTLDALLAAASRPHARVEVRAPFEMRRIGVIGPPVQGFVMGAAGFVRATALALEIHRAQVFQNAALGLALAGAVAGSFKGARWGDLRRGEPVNLAIDGGVLRAGPRLLVMATTLERLPFAMRPFGPAVAGLKFLDVDAPPRRLAGALPRLLWGQADGWLQGHGYRRGRAKRLELTLDGPIIVDGEVYPGGDLTFSEGPALRFLVP